MSMQRCGESLPCTCWGSHELEDFSSWPHLQPLLATAMSSVEGQWILRGFCVLQGETSLSFPASTPPPHLRWPTASHCFGFYVSGWKGCSAFLPSSMVLVGHYLPPREEPACLQGNSLNPPALHLHSFSCCIQLVRLSQERTGRWAQLNRQLCRLGIWTPHANPYMATKSLRAVHLVFSLPSSRMENNFWYYKNESSHGITLLLRIDYLFLRFSSFQCFCIFIFLSGFQLLWHVAYRTCTHWKDECDSLWQLSTS